MLWRNALIQTIKQEYKNLSATSLKILLKFEQGPQCNLWGECVYSRLHSSKPKLSPSDFTERSTSWSEPHSDTVKPLKCLSMLRQKTKSQHKHRETRRGETHLLKANVLVWFTYAAVHICNSLSLSSRAFFVKHTTEIKNTGVPKKKKDTGT